MGHFAKDCRTSIDKIPKFHENTAQFATDQDNDGSEYVFTSSQRSESTTLVSTFFQSDYEDAWILDIEAT